MPRGPQTQIDDLIPGLQAHAIEQHRVVLGQLIGLLLEPRFSRVCPKRVNGVGVGQDFAFPSRPNRTLIRARPRRRPDGRHLVRKPSRGLRPADGSRALPSGIFWTIRTNRTGVVDTQSDGSGAPGGRQGVPERAEISDVGHHPEVMRCRWRTRQTLPDTALELRTSPRSVLLEHQSVVVQQLPLEADAVGAHARGEREPEVGAGEPAGGEPELQQRLPDARRREPPAPLADGLDVVEPAVRARHRRKCGSAPRRSAPAAAGATSRGTGGPAVRGTTRRTRAGRRCRRRRAGSCSVRTPSSAGRSGRCRGARSRRGRRGRGRSRSWRPARYSSGEQKCSKAPRLATASKGPKLSRVRRRPSKRWTSRPWRRHAAAWADESVTPTPRAPRRRTTSSSGPQPQPRSSTRRPGPMPSCSAT